MVHLLTCFLNVPLKCMWSLFTQYIEARQIYPNNLLSRHLSDPGKSRPRCQINCCEVVMPNIKILFSNQIYTVLKKKSALCQAKQITICNITQSMKDSDFHFDTVWCCLCSFVCSCTCIVMPVCVYVWAGMHACAYPAHEFKYLESEKKKNGMWLQSMERLHLENKLYDKSFLFSYSDWQSSNAAEQRGVKRRKTKERQNWSCQFVPELSQTIPICSQWGFLSVGSRLHCRSISLSVLVYISGSGAWND